jgi:hypothetical protein
MESEKWHPESVNGGNIFFVARKCFGINQRAQVLVLKRLIWYLCQEESMGNPGMPSRG